MQRVIDKCFPSELGQDPGSTTDNPLGVFELPDVGINNDFDPNNLDFLVELAGEPATEAHFTHTEEHAQKGGTNGGWQDLVAAGAQQSIPSLPLPLLDGASTVFHFGTLPQSPQASSQRPLGVERPLDYPEAGQADTELETDDEVGKPSSASKLHKVEQNRKAQARFRQRKKERLNQQQRQIEELTAKLSLAKQEVQVVQERASLMQQMMTVKDRRIKLLQTQSKENVASEELVEAFWEMVCELKRGRHVISYSREDISGMVNSMLNHWSVELGFIRREVVGQLVDCINSDGERETTPAFQWLSNLITAYNRMVQRCGECNPMAFRTFLGLRLPEQTGLSVNAEFWKKALDAGGLTPVQKDMLLAAHKKLMSKMQQLLDRRDSMQGLATCEKDSASSAQQLLGDIAHVKDMLDTHAHILNEEQAAVFKFRTTVGLVLEPVQQAKLMIASFPFALDTLAICSAIRNYDSRTWHHALGGVAFLTHLPQDSPFQSLAPNNSFNIKPASQHQK